MKYVQQSAKLIGIQSPIHNTNGLKIVEQCARVCYKSEDKITDDSYIDFCAKLEGYKHWAVFEHCIYPITLSKAEYNLLLTSNAFNNLYGVTVQRVWDTYNLVINHSHLLQLKENEDNILKQIHFVSRILSGNHKSKEATDFNTFYTFKLTTFRSVADELFRHRKDALNMESSRYCNYSKNKFGAEIKTIDPHWVLNREVYGDNTEVLNIKLHKYLREAESNYLDLVNSGMKPQDARAVLPLDYAVDCCITASKQQWDYIINLRSSKAAHPNIQLLMGLIKNELSAI